MALSVSVLTRFDCKTEIIWYFGCFWESVKAITPTSQRVTRWISVPQNICSFLDLMILMFCGLTGKRNFWMLLTFMLHSELDELE